LIIWGRRGSENMVEVAGAASGEVKVRRTAIILAKPQFE
jgi:hypothetical protein